MVPLGRLTWQPSHNFFFPGLKALRSCPKSGWSISFLSSLLELTHLDAAREWPVNFPFSPFLPRTIQKLPEIGRSISVLSSLPSSQLPKP